MKLVPAVSALALAACAERVPPPPVAPKRDLVAERRLDAALTEHRKLTEDLAEVSTSRREKCEFETGDCLILVGDERDELVNAEDLSECNVMPDPPARLKCLSDALVARGKDAELASFYEYDNSCTRTLLSCTAALEAKAAESAVEARAEARRRELEGSARGSAAGGLVDAARARAEYLRATLPPEKSSACALSDSVASCVSGLAKDRAELADELRKDDYGDSIAVALYEKIATAEARCHDPEIACLSSALEPYGLYPESKKWLAQNLSILLERSELARRVPPRSRSSCLTGASTEHQDAIVKAYVAYAHDPVLFFRVQLEKAFFAMHQAEVACLSRATAGKAAKTANLVPASR